MKLKQRNVQEINTGSMADIAFLLLIFFLVSTTILQEQGLSLNLPPEPEDEFVSRVNDRNLFKIQINSNNQFLIEDEVRPDLQGLREEIEAFVQNNGVNPRYSDSPLKATISVKTNRGTDYKYFIAVLDEVKEAYYEIYAQRVNMSADEYRALDLNDPVQQHIYEKGKAGIPMNISIAEPDQTNS
ncbi:MAG: biopolymer transporter ExbD [Marinoscillum sp.]